MLEYFKKFKEFGLEMVIGLLLAIVGLTQLLTKFPLIKLTSDSELNEKVAAALVTIGGTVLLSGIFRFAFSIRLDNTETKIIGALRHASHEFIGTIASLQPKGLNPRPHDRYAAYKYLYWRTKNDMGTVMWLSFAPFTWRMRVLPFFDTHATIDGPEFKEFRYFLAMVQLQNCLAITATRVNPDDTPFGEMAGVYVFPIPFGAFGRLCGFLRHQNMAGHQSLSSCILTTEEIKDAAELDAIWLRGCSEAQVDRNLPAAQAQAQRIAAE
jgi:hypothetical protein